LIESHARGSANQLLTHRFFNLIIHGLEAEIEKQDQAIGRA
jgi:hypothetical protein